MRSPGCPVSSFPVGTDLDGSFNSAVPGVFDAGFVSRLVGFPKVPQRSLAAGTRRAVRQGLSLRTASPCWRGEVQSSGLGLHVAETDSEPAPSRVDTARLLYLGDPGHASHRGIRVFFQQCHQDQPASAPLVFELSAHDMALIHLSSLGT